MGLSVTGENNRLLIVENGEEREINEEIPGFEIEISGNNNLIRIEYPQCFEKSRLKIVGDNNEFSKKASVRKTADSFFYVGNGSRITIGRNCFFNGGIGVFAKEKTGVSVVLGDDVIIGSGSVIRTGDGHTIVDAGSRDPLNEPRDIKIGSHVWVGARVMLLKGAEIGAHSIVGAMSLVNKKFDEKNVIIAGVPARVIRRDVDWDISDYAAYTEI